MKVRLLGLSCALLPLAAASQTLVISGATLNITGTATLVVTGDILASSGSTISNDGSLSLSGTLTNNATMSAAGTGTLVFSGTTGQTLNGSAAYLADNVTVNNPGGLILASPLRVDGALNFTNGIITAPVTAPVVFTANGSIGAAPSNTSHVSGVVTKEGTGSFTFPVGDGARYQPATVNLTVNSAGFSAKYNAGPSGTAPYGTTGFSAVPLMFTNQREYWDLGPVGAGTASGTVAISWDGYNNTGIASTADLRVAHKQGGQWLNEGAASVSGTTASGSVTSGTVTTWSPFTLGSISAASALPVKLLAFSASALGTRNEVSWKVAMEETGTEYHVERSADGRAFQEIVTLQATPGNRGSYGIVDGQPGRGTAYYRLRITAGAGVLYSAVVPVNRASAIGLSLAPNPAHSTLTIDCTDAALAGKTISVTNAAGQLVWTAVIANTLTLDIGAWSPGIYTVSVPGYLSQRLIKE